MPELPEVEIIRQDLKNKVINKKIVDVLLTPKARIQGVSQKKFKQILQGNKFIDIDRIGKLLIFTLGDRKHFLLVHLKMTGQLIWVKELPHPSPPLKQGREIVAGGHSVPEVGDSLPNKFTRVVFILANKSKIYFNDMRRFGYMKIVDKKGLEKIKAQFGIEPLTKEFTLENFKKALAGRKTSIKAVLLNQKLIAGIGNIYADEACFLAKIKPSRRVDSLCSTEIKRLHRACETVIKKAILKRGTTFNNYVDSEGRSGNFVEYLKVYGRGGLKCRRCKGVVLCKTKVAGRGTCYCPICQV